MACRAEPRTGAPVLRGRQPGYVFPVADSDTDEGGATWYADNIPGGVCWVFGPLTIEEASPDEVLLAVADHALSLGEETTFEHLVAVDNLIIERKRRMGRFFRGAPESVPPLVELRHLEVVARAARRSGLFMSQPRDPLRLAWVLAHDDVVQYYEIGGGYGVGSEHFWDLYQRFSDTAQADAIAWTAAGALVPADECFTSCMLFILNRTFGRYWTTFPDGDHVAEALSVGAERVWLASTYCALLLEGDPRADRESIRETIGPVRASLTDIDPRLAAPMESGLDDIERFCLDSDARALDDPGAIPILLRGLGNGFSFIPRSLAAFGETVVEDLVEAANTASQPNVTRNALITLRLIVETHDRLPRSTIERIRTTAMDWIDRGGRSENAAIDLARAVDEANQDVN